MGTPRLSVALPDQHARLADGAGPVAGPARHAGRHSGRRARPPGRDGLRLDLVPERLADGPGGTARLARQPGVAARIPGHAAGPPRGRHRGVRLRHHRLRRPRPAGRRRGACAPARAAPRARPPAAARFRPEPHGPGSPVGGGAPRVLRPGHRRRPRARAAELHAAQGRARRSRVRLRTRSVLRRLARHAAARTTRIPPRRRR